MKYFLIGIKGIGMVSIATLYKEWGHEVCGSDTKEQFFTDRILKDLGISVVSFDETYITSDLDAVIYSSAYGENHPQIKKARDLNIKCVSYGEALAEIFNSRRGILVTGTHGKTTSAAMLARVLEDAGLDPTAVVGGEVLEWGRSARAGKATPKDNWMVAEGDEYQAKILMLKPQLLLLTNIEYDHPDFYKDEAAYRATFQKLLQELPQTAEVVAHQSLKDFVRNATAAHVVFFDGENDEELRKKIKLKIWGEHNKTNALGVLRAAKVLGINEASALETLRKFRGTRRRMELYTKEDASIVVMDDYAHHPTEIKATLRALRAQYPTRRLVAVFQPHTYSRTKALLNDFAQAFEDTDMVVLLDIYASAREKEKSIRGEDLLKEIKKYHATSFFAASCDDAYRFLAQEKKTGDVIVTLGAGDVWRVAERLTHIATQEAQQ